MRKLTSQKLFRSRKWRLVSVELWNKFAYCPTWTLYNVWSFHKHNSSRFMLIRAFINVSESFNFNKTAKAIFGQLLNTFCNFLYTLGNFLCILVNLYTHWATFCTHWATFCTHWATFYTHWATFYSNLLVIWEVIIVVNVVALLLLTTLLSATTTSIPQDIKNFQTLQSDNDNKMCRRRWWDMERGLQFWKV